jgi:hypothetical protein
MAKAFVTIFTKANKTSLSKSIALNDGHPVSDGSLCRMSEGSGVVVEAATAGALADLINGLASHNALALGVLKGVEPDHNTAIVARSRSQSNPNALNRTLEHMHFEPGQPAWLLLDFDQKGMPGEVEKRLETEGGFEAAIAKVLEKMPTTARVIRASTSSGLRNTTTGELYAGSGGLHLYILVQDGADIPRFLDALFGRLWLEGFGWVTVSKAGAFLTRSIVDAAVGSPERLVFEGPPTLGPELEQDLRLRAAKATEGAALDSRTCIDLSPAEEARFRFLLDTAKVASAREAETVRAVWLETTARRVADKTKKPIATARAELKRSFAGCLHPDFVLRFDNLGDATVGDVLDDPERFINETLADPHEPEDRRRNCAILYRGQRAGSLFVWSHAHGGLTYQLAHDYASLSQLIEKTAADDVADAFCSALPLASLTAKEELLLEIKARTKAGLSKADWNKLIKIALGSRTKASVKEPAIEKEPPTRPYLLKPYEDAELNATLQPLDDLLCTVTVSEPPFRTLSGSFAVVAERALSITHQLSGSEPEPGSTWLPPPPITSIFEADSYTVLANIEPFVEYRHYVNPSFYHETRLPSFFASAYRGWKLSKLPKVEMVLTLPMVQDGKIVGGSGLDRKLQVIFRIDPKALEVMPKGPVPVGEAKQSYGWLRDEFLNDVAFGDDKDAAKAIAVCLTIIERFLFNGRTMFLVTGDVAGGGKSTLINMLVAAVTGNAAPAMAWSNDPDERKKAIFAVGLAALPCIVFDNIERGTSIDCPHLSRMSTSAEMSDRVLGESRTETVSAKTVVLFNGNGVETKGDPSTRTLRIGIESTGLNPAGRAFAREQPVEWVIENRLTILYHLYRVLMVERARPARLKTRFKTWWELVGHPLEIVSGIDFATEINENADADEETSAKSRVVERLWNEFGKIPERWFDHKLGFLSVSAPFFAKNVAELLPHERMDDTEQKTAGGFAADLRTVRGEEFSSSAEGVGWVLKRHVTGWVELSDGKEARLVYGKNTGKQNSYRVEVKSEDLQDNRETNYADELF